MDKWIFGIDDEIQEFLEFDDNGVGHRLYLSSPIQGTDEGEEFMRKVLDKLNNGDL